jgi:hypothetical protein
MRLLKKGSSENFQKACEKFFFSSDDISDDPELIILARETCKETSMKQTDDAPEVNMKAQDLTRQFT